VKQRIEDRGSRTEADSPSGFLSGWTRFWFSAIDPRGLHALRVLSGLLFLLWLLPLAGHQTALFGLNGWFDWKAYHEGARLPEGPAAPYVSWSLLYLSGSSAILVDVLWWVAVAVIALFTLGLWVRVTAVLTWVLVASFLLSPAVNYDADYLLAILAFYLMIGYVLLGQWSQPLSLAGRLLGPRDTFLFRKRKDEADGSNPPSYAANLALRLLQVHFALIMVVSGVHKLQFGEWWGGVAYWYPLHPPFQTTLEDIRAEAPHASLELFLLSLIAYLALAWQISFPAFAWRRRWRVVLLGGAILSWVGALYIYGQPLFGPVYVIACLSYLTPAEWEWLTARMGQLTGLVTREVQSLPEPRAGVRTKIPS
jgi:hypothetical protein